MIRTFALLGLSLSLLGLAGCALFVKALEAVPSTEPPKYATLSGQNVAVMVWAEDNGVKIDWPRLQVDLASMIQSKLQQTQTAQKPKELEKTRFTVSPGAVAHYQEDHPEIAAMSISDVAPKLGVSRLIYVEIRGFQTRSDSTNDLFRGQITGTVSIVKVADGKGRQTMVDDKLGVVFPRNCPAEGLPNVGDRAIYEGALDGFSSEVVKRFVTHPDAEDLSYRNIASR